MQHNKFLSADVFERVSLYTHIIIHVEKLNKIINLETTPIKPAASICKALIYSIEIIVIPSRDGTYTFVILCIILWLCVQQKLGIIAIIIAWVSYIGVHYL